MSALSLTLDEVRIGIDLYAVSFDVEYGRYDWCLSIISFGPAYDDELEGTPVTKADIIAALHNTPSISAWIDRRVDEARSEDAEECGCQRYHAMVDDRLGAFELLGVRA